MRVLPVLLIAACAHSAPEIEAAPAPAPAAPAAAAPASPPPAAAPAPSPAWDDATVIDKSTKLLAAVDNYDFAAYSLLVDPASIEYGNGRSYDLGIVKHSMQGQLDHHLPAQTRTCNHQRVFRGETALIYIDYCDVTFPAHDDLATYKESIADSIVWTPRGGDWKVVYYGVESMGLEAEGAMWDNTFHTGIHFKTTANQLLIDTVKDRKPGKALDIAMGQGRNVLYLASKGWKTTGIDISDEGMKIAQDHAAKQKLKIETIHHDMETFDFGKDKWDLVTMIYMGNHHDMIEKVKPSLRKGGLFVVEFFAKESTKNTGIGGFEPGELKPLFDDGKWTIIKDEVVEDVADWGLAKTKLVRFVAQKK